MSPAVLFHVDTEGDVDFYEIVRSVAEKKFQDLGTSFHINKKYTSKPKQKKKEDLVKEQIREMDEVFTNVKKNVDDVKGSWYSFF